MESINLDMDDLFEDRHEGGDFGNIAPQMDDDDAPMGGGDDDEPQHTQGDEDASDVLNRLKKATTEAEKKKRKPIPKLDVERLSGNRGFAVLPKLFTDVKWKGKGHEAGDLKILMNKMEHWAHRLFPKASFDDFIDRMEKQGYKQGNQTLLNKIRNDMPVLDEDYMQQYDSDNSDGDNGAKDDTQRGEQTELDAADAFDELIRQERELMGKKAAPAASQSAGWGSQSVPAGSQSAAGGPYHAASDDYPDDLDRDNAMEEAASDLPSTSNLSTSSTVTQKTDQSSAKGLSEEVRERMEINKRLAMEKRMKRMGITPQKDTSADTSLIEKHITSFSSPKSTSSQSESDKAASTPSWTNAQRVTLSGTTQITGGESNVDLHTTKTMDADTSLHLHLTETENSEEASLNLHMTESEQTENASLNLHMTESEQSENASLNLHMTESERTENASLNLHMTESEKTESASLNLHMTASEAYTLPVDIELQTDTDMDIDDELTAKKLSDSPKLRNILGSDGSDPGQLGQLKLSLSDSEATPVDTSIDDDAIA